MQRLNDPFNLLHIQQIERFESIGRDSALELGTTVCASSAFWISASRSVLLSSVSVMARLNSQLHFEIRSLYKPSCRQKRDHRDFARVHFL